MRIGVVSDSHGNIDLLEKAGNELIKELNSELIIHLGDDSIEADMLRGRGVPIIIVPGVYEDRYRDKSFINRRIEEYDRWKFLITHTKTPHENDSPDDLDPVKTVEDSLIDVVLHGHSHIPAIEVIDGVLYVNPGHLKQEDKKGYPPSYAFLDTADNSISVIIRDLNKGEILKSMEKMREAKKA